MKLFLIMAGLVFGSAQAMAKDSVQLYCGNSKITVNINEYRSSDGMGRDTEIAIFYGTMSMKSVLNLDSPVYKPDANGFQKVVVLGQHQRSNNFAGKIKIDYARSRVSLQGTLRSDSGAPLAVRGTYNCVKKN